MAAVIGIARGRIWDVVRGSLTDNPIIIKDFRTRMRGRKAFSLMGGYVALMLIVMAIALRIMWDMYAPGGTLRPDAEFGKYLFVVLNIFQTLFLTLIIPIVGSNSITHELEQKTVESLVMTRVSSLGIVFGKTMSVFLYAMVLVAASVPLAGLCLMLGGISPGEIAYTYAVLAGWVLLLASFAVMWSSLFTRTPYATLVSLSLSLLYFLQSSGLLYTLIYLFGYRALMSFGRMFTGYSSGSYAGYSVATSSNPIFAPLGAYENIHVFGLHVPCVLAGVVSSLLTASILVLLASSHIRYRRIESALAVRLLILVRWVLLALISLGVASRTGWSRSEFQVYAGMIVAGLAIGLMPCVAPVCSGEIRRNPGQGVFAYAFSFRRTFKTDIGGAIPFSLLWTLVSFSATILAFVLAFPAVPKVLMGHLWLMFAKAGAISLAVVFAVGALGVFLSCVSRSRRAALGILLIPVMLAFVVNMVMPVSSSYMIRVLTRQSRQEFTDTGELSAFWPPTAIMMTSAAGSGGPMPPLWAESAWLDCTLGYTILGFGLLLVAAPVLKRTGGVKEETS